MSSSDCISAYVEESPELSAPFAMAFGPEIVDTRISPQARLLRLWLRFRCAGQYERNVVSFETLAEDFGAGVSTVRKWVDELRSIGAITCSKRGFGRTDKKVLSAPSAVYDTPTLVSFRRLLRSERTDEDIKRLRSEALDNHANSSALGNERSTPLESERSTPLESERSEVKEREVEETSTLSESTRNVAAAQRTNEREGENQCVYEKSTTLCSELRPSLSHDKEPEPEKNAEAASRPVLVVQEPENRLAQCKSMVDNVEVMAKARAMLAKERAEVKSRARERSGEAEAAKSAREAQKKLLRAQRGPTANDVEDWWNTRMRDLYPEIPNMGWTTREKAWARQLLDRMGADNLTKLFDLIFEKWETFQLRFSSDNLPQAPIFSWVYMKRERLSQEVVTIKPKGASVSSPDAKRQKFGW